MGRGEEMDGREREGRIFLYDIIIFDIIVESSNRNSLNPLSILPFMDDILLPATCFDGLCLSLSLDRSFPSIVPDENQQ